MTSKTHNCTASQVCPLPESLSHPGEASVPAPEGIVPPGTKAFPVVSSDYTKPVEPEPLRETLYRHEAASYPADISDRDEWRDTHQTPMKTPASLLSSTEDVTRTITPGEDEYLGGQGKVNVERPKELEEDPAEIVESLGRMKVTDEKPGRGFESDFPTRSHEFGLKNESTGTHDQFSPELSPPKEAHVAKPSTYTEKIGSATSFVTDKAIAAKNAVASKLGYAGESGKNQSSAGDEATPRSATGYGQKVAGTVANKLTPVYEKVKETGSTVLTKLPLSGGGSGAEEKQQVEGKGVLTRDYLAEKLRPGEEDKALAEVIAEKLHLGGGEKKKTMSTKEVEVTVEKILADQTLVEKEHGEAEEAKVGGEGGMVEKLKGAVTSWLGGTTEELKPKSSDSVDQSSQSLGSTVGTTGFPDSGGALTGQRGLQDSGN